MGAEYRTEKEKENITKSTIELLKREGYMTEDGIIHVQLVGGKDVKKGDLLITKEILTCMRIDERFTDGLRFDCPNVLPICCVNHERTEDLGSKWTNCGHGRYRHLDFGQNGIAKLVKVKK